MLARRSEPRRLSTQNYLLILVAAVVIPLLVFAGFVLTRYATSERARFERDAAQIAQQVSVVIDSELAELVALLKGLAASSALQAGDFGRFHAEATRLARDSDAVVVLRELGDRQIVNTQLPFGAPLPAAVPLTAREEAAFLSGKSVVSNVYASPISGEARIAVAIPLADDGRPNHVLAITVPTSRIRDALLPAVPPGWFIGVGDAVGTIVTRSQRHEDFTGKPGLPEYLARAVGRSGTFVSTSFEGLALLAGYHRSEFSDWLVGANIPLATVQAPLWRSLGTLAALGVAALALSALLAFLFGTGLTAATKRLAQYAEALGEGRPVPPMPSRLAEFARVGEALQAAAAAVRERTHELEIVLATVPAAVWFTYDGEVRHVARNRFAAELMGLDEEADRALEGAIPAGIGVLQDGRPLEPEAMPLQRAMRGERVEDEEYTFVFPDGATRTLLTSATALRDDAGSIIGAVAVSLDISERKQSEEQRRLLIHELNHRVKNTLATVQSIALQTLRGAASLSDAGNALTDRLVALAKAHDVLTRESWEGAELHDIVAEATRPHAGPDRFVVNGPPVWLTPALGLSVALILHELATNAAKYGALSTENGSVAISWDVIGSLGDPRLRLRWAERGGPPVRPPARQGFGSRLIRRSHSAEMGGTATIDYAPDGVVCVLEMPIRRTGPAESAPAA